MLMTRPGIMQSTGIKVIGMLGGAAPGTYTCLTPALFNTYYPVLKGYIKRYVFKMVKSYQSIQHRCRYHIDGLDLDVEQDTPLADIIHLIKQLKKDFGEHFIITLAPVASALVEEGNLSGFDYITLEKEIGHEIAWYNAQFYSGFGFFFPDDMYLDIVNFGRGLDPSRLVATTLTNPDDGSGFIDIDQVVSSVTDLAKKHNFNFGGVAGWELWNALPGGENQPYLWAKLMSDTMKGIKENQTQLLANSKSVQRSRMWPRSQ
jgi:hypothetical protein